MMNNTPVKVEVNSSIETWWLIPTLCDLDSNTNGTFSTEDWCHAGINTGVAARINGACVHLGVYKYG